MNVNAVLHDVKETDKSLKAIAAEHGLKSGLHVTSLCLEYGISKAFLKARADRMRRLNASRPRPNGRGPKKQRDKFHRPEPTEFIRESMTGDGFSLYWLGRKWA
jgi:hypothetical protein